MDTSEKIVNDLLHHIGFTNVVYEPDGNVPPDFLADSRVAVEVRRLNQNFDSGNGMRGLEEAAIPLWQRVENLAKSLGAATGESWFVFIRFSRPLKLWKEIEPKIRSALVAFQQRATKTGGSIYSTDGFELEVFKASKAHQTYYLMGGRSDRQSGGFIVAEMIKNIEHCSDEKLKKIAEYRSRYSEWWLALVDHIGLGLDDFDKQQFLTTYAKRPAGWDKIIVVSPNDPTRYFEF